MKENDMQILLTQKKEKFQRNFFCCAELIFYLNIFQIEELNTTWQTLIIHALKQRIKLVGDFTDLHEAAKSNSEDFRWSNHNWISRIHDEHFKSIFILSISS